jgi:hypothetical protein
MTKEEFYERFSLEEWELLCSKIEFLDVFVTDPFDAELADAVARRILAFDSRQITRRPETGGALED